MSIEEEHRADLEAFPPLLRALLDAELAAGNSIVEVGPFFLRFHTTDRAEREAVFRELCETIGVDASRYLES